MTQNTLVFSVVIDGKTYTREALEQMPRDPDLRNLARWIQEHERPNTSRAWIGSAASKADLVDYCMGAIVSVKAQGDGSYATRGSNDLSTVPAASQNGKPGSAASLMMQAVQAIAESSVTTEALEERLEGFAGSIRATMRAELERELLEAQQAMREEFDALLAKGPKPTRVEVSLPNGEVKACGVQHKQFPVLVRLLAARVNVALVGPAGSGKTRAMHEAAKALGLEFEALSVGPQTTQSQLMGYMDANGKYVSTAFRRRFENGGVILLDEFDAGNAGVGTCTNSATANQGCGFPDDYIWKHGDNVVGISMNTFNGANRQYVGRAQQDAATLDRFFFIDWQYDEELEREIALAQNPNAGPWVDRVQQLRRNAEASGQRVIVSPRASEMGARLLLQGFDFEFLEQGLIFKGHDAATVAKVKGA